MSRFEIVVEPFSSLYVGGYAQARRGSDGDTASDAGGLLLPGSAVKGALREAAARLVNGAGHGKDLLAELFGGSDQPGLLRVGTLRPRWDESAGEGTIRNHVSLERATRQAAPQRLFQNRVTPALKGLSFCGVIESRRSLDEEELGLLSSAVQLTDQIGGGRGRGLGLVLVSLTELGEAAPGPEPELGEETTTLILTLEVEEPLHLSSVKDPSNYVSSKDSLDGSTVRGAVAAALAGFSSDAELELVLGGAAPAVFGDGRAGSSSAIPRPMTLEEPKSGGPLTDKAALLCAEACGGRAVKWPDDRRYTRGTVVHGEEGWSTYPVKRRTVTRTARDHASGRAADGQLFSLEVLDPVLDRPDAQYGRRHLCFHVPVSGDSQQLHLVLQAASAGLAVGGDRSRGFGRLRLLSFQTEPALGPLEERHARWAELVARQGVPNPEATGVLLAVGSLAVSQQRLTEALGAFDLDLVEGVARRNVHGGWNAKIQLSRSLCGHFLPGSTFLVTRRGEGSALSALAAVEEHGIGPGRADGQGRLIACHPIHVDCFKED